MYTKVLFSVLFVFLTLFTAFSQCPTEVVKIGRSLAKESAYKAMKQISPNTGHSEDWTLQSCNYDQLNGYIVFKVELTWSAKTQMYFGESGKCVVYADIKISDEDSSDSKFVITDMNSFARTCVASRKWDVLEGAVNAAMNSKGGGE